MPPLIALNDVSIAFGVRELFSGVSFRLEEGEKAALAGANGSGKTTLLALMEGLRAPDSGEITRGKLTVTSIMAQELDTEETALNTALSVFAPLFEMEDELGRVAQELCEELPEERRARLIARQQTLTERFQDAGGLTARSRARSSLLALGISEGELSLPLKSLSGGQQAKVRLAMALLKAPNLLLLDEPTNHLDLAAIEWLEEFLAASPSALIVVSHDRAFLDRVTSRTLEIEEGRLFDYPVPYTAHIERRAQRREAERRVYANTRKEIERLEGIVEQQRRWNRERNIRMAESKQKMIDRLEAELVKPAADPETLRLSFPVEVESGDDVLIAEGLSKSFDQKHLFENASMHIRKGERVVLVGGNGVGKTTLLRILTGALAPDTGTVRLGANVRIGVYEQGQASLVASRTALEEVHASCPGLTLTAVRNAMAAFLFRGDDVFKPVSVLSGGEKARVALLKLIFSGANFLLLDEPTNHLDAASREALENALAGYAGTILAVSHDRYFISKLAQRVGRLTRSGLTFYPALADVPRERAQAATAQRNTEYAERKAKGALVRKLGSQAEKSRARIEALEAEIERLEAALESTGSDFEAAQRLSDELGAARNQLDEAYALWLSAHEELENINQ